MFCSTSTQSSIPLEFGKRALVTIVRTKLRKASLTVALTAIAAVIGSSVVTAPADAATAFYQVGSPGTYPYWKVPAFCSQVSVGTNYRLTTDSPVVAASPNYQQPQTIQRRTRIETSTDYGRNWQIWYYLPSQTAYNVTPGNGVTFFTQDAFLYPGWSYRIVEGFDFWVGATYIGSRWYVLDRSDYNFVQNQWGTANQPFSTLLSPGCTIGTN